MASTGGASRGPTGRTATTATFSTPSCRPRNRPRRWPACASRRRCCCIGAHRVGDAELDAQVPTCMCSAWPATPTGRRSPELEPAPPRAGDARPRRKLSMEHDTTWLQTGLVYLAAAMVAVPLSRLLGLARSSATWRRAWPSAQGWAGDQPATILHVAEFGVMLMMFLVGLELLSRGGCGPCAGRSSAGAACSSSARRR